jgi:hypothetical protein
MEIEVDSHELTGSTEYHAVDVTVKHDSQKYELSFTIAVNHEENSGSSETNVLCCEWLSHMPQNTKTAEAIIANAEKYLKDNAKKIIGEKLSG